MAYDRLAVEDQIKNEDFVGAYRAVFPPWGTELRMYVPEHMHGPVVRYILQGILQDDFLIAFIKGDLFQAFRYADDINRHNFLNWSIFFFNYAPSACFDGVENVEDWIAWKGKLGMDHVEEAD